MNWYYRCSSGGDYEEGFADKPPVRAENSS
jgi:hypothetical protein